MASLNQFRRAGKPLTLAAAVAAAACVGERALQPVEPEQTPASAFAPTLANSFLDQHRSAIVVVQIDSLNGHLVAHGGVALLWHTDWINPGKEAVWVPQPVGRFAVVHLAPDTTYRIKCLAGNMHTVWSHRIRLAPQAVDTIVCRMQRRGPREPPDADPPKHLPD